MNAPATSPSAGRGCESESNDVDAAGVAKRRVAPLFARRRQNLDRDGHISCHDYVSDDGRKIRELTRDGAEGTEKTIQINYSAMLGAAPSTTSNMELLRIEAQQAADASPEERETMNQHVPSNDDILETATAEIEREGLTPAWEVCDR